MVQQNQILLLFSRVVLLIIYNCYKLFRCNPVSAYRMTDALRSPENHKSQITKQSILNVHFECSSFRDIHFNGIILLTPTQRHSTQSTYCLKPVTSIDMHLIYYYLFMSCHATIQVSLSIQRKNIPACWRFGSLRLACKAHCNLLAKTFPSRMRRKVVGTRQSMI